MPGTSLLETWVEDCAKLTRPDQVVWCDGSAAEYQRLVEGMLHSGEFIQINETAYPNSYLHRSSPTDVARTEDLTYICTSRQEDAGPTNNWMAPDEAKAMLRPALRRLHARAHHVCRALSDGPRRLAARQGRRRDHRQPLRRRQPAHHDAHGRRSRSTRSRRTAANSIPACTPSATSTPNAA